MPRRGWDVGGGRHCERERASVAVRGCSDLLNSDRIAPIAWYAQPLDREYHSFSPTRLRFKLKDGANPDMDATVIVGRCTTSFDGSRDTTQHGDVIVLVKPDGTVLVHDADGYQPVAWLTRPESVTVTDDRVTATDGDQQLVVDIDDANHQHTVAMTEAGTPMGNCPDCGRTLVRTRGSVSCPDCGNYSLPAKATVREEVCTDCGLPMMQVDRGEPFNLCIDRDCESLDARVKDTFDRTWDCPDCGGDLRVLRRGGLILGCEQYPDCETGFAFPGGSHVGTCSCGLPMFEISGSQRCLDSTCEAHAEPVAATE